MEWMTELVPGLLALLAALMRIEKWLIEAQLRAEIRRLRKALRARENPCSLD